MSILGRVLMLVACVPLLQPTGYCVCKAGGRDRASPRQEPTVAWTCSPTAQQKSGCCSQRHTQDAADNSVSSEADGQPQHPCPTPSDDHLPGCPASPGVDRFKWVEPTSPITTALPPLELDAFLPIEVNGPTLPPIPTSTNPPALLPLYLTHCSLVI